LLEGRKKMKSVFEEIRENSNIFGIYNQHDQTQSIYDRVKEAYNADNVAQQKEAPVRNLQAQVNQSFKQVSINAHDEYINLLDDLGKNVFCVEELPHRMTEKGECIEKRLAVFEEKFGLYIKTITNSTVAYTGMLPVLKGNAHKNEFFSVKRVTGKDKDGNEKISFVGFRNFGAKCSVMQENCTDSEIIKNGVANGYGGKTVAEIYDILERKYTKTCKFIYSSEILKGESFLSVAPSAVLCGRAMTWPLSLFSSMICGFSQMYFILQSFRFSFLYQ